MIKRGFKRAAKPLKMRLQRRRRKKGEITKAKAKLWELCRSLIKKNFMEADGSWTCYTCPQKIVPGQKQFHTGHFIVSSMCSVELRYDLKNLAPQCAACNIWRGGNWPVYEEHLIRDHGVEYVQELKTRNAATKGKQYPLEWFAEKIQEYEQILNKVGENPLHKEKEVVTMKGS